MHIRVSFRKMGKGGGGGKTILTKKMGAKGMHTIARLLGRVWGHTYSPIKFQIYTLRYAFSDSFVVLK